MPKKPNEFACTVKRLPDDKQIAAAEVAVEMNPTNSPNRQGLPETVMALMVEPQHLAVLTTRYWGTKGIHLGVSFLDTNNQSLINAILSHMNAWTEYANIEFKWSQSGGEVRISRGPGGYWSYLGTDILSVSRGQQTMNLQGITGATDPKEMRRVITHETGHTCGFPHEHLRQAIVNRLDESKTLAYFKRWQGWDEATIRGNVLTPLEESSLMASAEADEASIMAYPLPASITKDGRPIVGGTDLSPTDKEFVAKLYPKAVTPPAPPPTGGEEVIVIKTAGTYVLKKS